MHIHFIQKNFNTQFVKPLFRTGYVLFVCVDEGVSARNLSRVFIALAANHSRAVKAQRYVSIYAGKRVRYRRAIYSLYRVPSKEPPDASPRVGFV